VNGWTREEDEFTPGLSNGQKPRPAPNHYKATRDERKAKKAADQLAAAKTRANRSAAKSRKEHGGITEDGQGWEHIRQLIQIRDDYRPAEDWRIVPGTAGKYSVSSTGHVRRNWFARNGLKHPHVRQRIDSTGYMRVDLSGERRRSVRVHALVAEAFIGPRPEGLHVNHKDGNKLNNDAGNLEYVSLQENTTHAVALGLIRHGERHGQAVLTESHAREALSLKGRVRQKDLAARFGVARSTIASLHQRRSWGELP
jgi:hypothetical protein